MDKKVLRWNFIFQYGYVLTNILNSVILLPFYLKKIDPATLGVWLATGNILAWMTLVDPGVGEVLQQKIADLMGRNQKEEIGQTIGSGLICAAIILCISIAAGFLFYSLVGLIINKDVTVYPHLQTALLISVISTGMSLTSFSISGINQGMHNASQVAISSILSNVLFLIMNLTLLIWGMGIISIALANLTRALFINIYNYFALRIILDRNGMAILVNGAHFKRFVRIFSVTSLSRIIGGLSGSMDTIVLARFITPAMITVFEINKRPIQLTQSLIGRHSVALMPNLSYAHGKNDRDGILALITSQFSFYLLAASFISLLFLFNYHELISAWTGKASYAGNTVVYLLIANFFVGLIGYFMSNMGYALGDIKMNSFIWIVKGLVMIVLLYVSARYYGIPGILSVMLAGNIGIDFYFFSRRLHILGYLPKTLVKRALRLIVRVLPLGCLSAAGCNYFVRHLVGSNHPMMSLILNGGSFTLLFAGLVIWADMEIRELVLSTWRRVSFVTFGRQVLQLNKKS